MRFSTRTRWITFSFCHTGKSLADEAWGPLQLEHSLGPSHRPSCLSFPQPGHFAAILQLWLMWPKLLGTNKATFTFRQPTVISFGRSGEPNVKKRVLVEITSPSFSVTQFTPTTPWSLSSSRIPTSDMSARSRHLITPREEFRVLWIETLTGLLLNRFVWSKFWA